jgi:hypothetical protein
MPHKAARMNIVMVSDQCFSFVRASRTGHETEDRDGVVNSGSQLMIVGRPDD